MCAPSFDANFVSKGRAKPRTAAMGGKGGAKPDLKRKRMGSASQSQLEHHLSRLNQLVHEKKSKGVEATVLQEPPARLRLGCDCAGLGSELMALRMGGFGTNQEMDLVLWSEICPLKRILFSTTHKICFGRRASPTACTHDMMRRDHESSRACDIYIAGPPCPPFSTAGKKLGVEDARSHLVFACLEYAVQHTPKVCIIENVRGLLQAKHKPVLRGITKGLRVLGYSVYVKLLNTINSGIPHSRPRVFIVGIHGGKQTFQWPPDLKLPKSALAKHLHTERVGDTVLDMTRFERRIGKKDLWEKGFIADVGASKRFAHIMRGKCPCLTRTRGSTHPIPFYIPKLKRYLKITEAGLLQGWPQVVLRRLLQEMKSQDPSRPSRKKVERVVGGALGDSISVNVLQRLLPRALHSAGLIAEVVSDPWEKAAHEGRVLTPDALWA